MAVGGLVALQHVPASPPASAEAITVSSGRSAAPALGRLVVFGHSMPAGSGASDPSLGYAVLTAQALDLPLANYADGGTGAANATKTMEAAPPVGPRDAVVLHTGLNDIFRRGDDAVARGRQAIRHFLQGTEDAGRRVVVLECQMRSWRFTPPERNLQAAYVAWNDMLREEAAASSDVEVLSTCEAWRARRYIDYRRYHPNDEGHALLAAQLTDLLSRP